MIRRSLLAVFWVFPFLASSVLGDSYCRDLFAHIEGRWRLEIAETRSGGQLPTPTTRMILKEVSTGRILMSQYMQGLSPRSITPTFSANGHFLALLISSQELKVFRLEEEGAREVAQVGQVRLRDFPRAYGGETLRNAIWSPKSNQLVFSKLGENGLHSRIEYVLLDFDSGRSRVIAAYPRVVTSYPPMRVRWSATGQSVFVSDGRGQMFEIFL